MGCIFKLILSFMHLYSAGANVPTTDLPPTTSAFHLWFHKFRFELRLAHIITEVTLNVQYNRNLIQTTRVGCNSENEKWT